MDVAAILQKAICNGSLGSHQNSVDGGYVGTRTPITVGKYWNTNRKQLNYKPNPKISQPTCVQNADSVCR